MLCPHAGDSQNRTQHANTPKSTAAKTKVAPPATKTAAPLLKAGSGKTSTGGSPGKTAGKPGTVPAKAKTAQTTASAKATPTVSPAPEKDLYTRAVGLRAGETSGLTYKQFFTDVEAFEGILGIWPNALGITGLYEKYVPFGNVEGLNWYFGGGAHLSIGTGKLYYYQREGNRYYTYRRNYPGLAIGLDGIVGAEYKIPKAPFAISFDIKPFIEVNNGGVLYTSFDPGLGIKVAF
jgi:hypothetical protein